MIIHLWGRYVMDTRLEPHQLMFNFPARGRRVSRQIAANLTTCCQMSKVFYLCQSWVNVVSINA